MNESNKKLRETVLKILSIVSDRNDGAFGQWINGLWGWHTDLSYTDQKDAFFFLLEKLLEDEIIVVFPPEELLKDPSTPLKSVFQHDNVWDVDAATVVEYVRDHWPPEVEDETDEKLVYFWYSDFCPRIAWVDKVVGRLVAS